MEDPTTPQPGSPSIHQNGPFRRSWSSPTLSQRNRRPSLNDQLLVFADKFVDTLDDNDEEIIIARSPSTSTISTNYWESEYNDDNSSWIASKIGYNTPYCKHRHSCFQVLSYQYLYTLCKRL